MSRQRRIAGPTAAAPGAIANADLSCNTRLEAAEGPGRLREQGYVDQTVGIPASAHGLDVDAAEQRLRSAAARAGVPVFVLAHAMVLTFDPET